MFDSITFKASTTPGQVLDVGAIAESLIFYGRVSIVGHVSVLQHLLKEIPPFIFLHLLESGRLEFHFEEKVSGVHTRTLPNGEVHDFCLVSADNHRLEFAAPVAFREATADTPQARLGAKKLVKLLKVREQGGGNEVLGSIVRDNVGLNNAIENALRVVVPSYEIPDGFFFHADIVSGHGIVVETNLDWAAVNAEYHRSVSPTHSTLSQAYLLGLIQAAHESIEVAASFNTEIAADPIDVAINTAALQAIVRRNQESKTQIHQFTEMTLESRTIRDAVNQKRVPFAAVVRLLDKADKFRDWLRKLDGDARLVNEFYKSATEKTWAEKLAESNVRYFFFTGAGVALDLALGTSGAATAATTAVSAFDGLVLDKLVRGWKPHHFVEKSLKPLVAGRKHQR